MNRRVQYKFYDLRVSTDEVNDEAAIGVAASGTAEECHAVGRLRGRSGERVLREHDDVISGVGEGVAEAENGVVAPEGRDGRLHAREEENGEDAEQLHPRSRD
jgi:hypothetical protein